jgi:hypothetical protein
MRFGVLYCVIAVSVIYWLIMVNTDCGLAPAISDEITLTDWRPTTEQMLRWRIVINPGSPTYDRYVAGVEMENRDDGERGTRARMPTGARARNSREASA